MRFVESGPAYSWLGDNLIRAANAQVRAERYKDDDMIDEAAGFYLELRDRFLDDDTVTDDEIEYVISVAEPEIAGKPWPAENLYGNLVLWGREMLERRRAQRLKDSVSEELERLRGNWQRGKQYKWYGRKMIVIMEQHVLSRGGPLEPVWFQKFLDESGYLIQAENAELQYLWKLAKRKLNEQEARSRSINGTIVPPTGSTDGWLRGALISEISSVERACFRRRISPDPDVPFVFPAHLLEQPAPVKRRRFGRR